MEDLTNEIKEALKKKNPDVYLRDNLGISRSEARKHIARYHHVQKKRFAHNLFASAAAAVVLGIGLALYQSIPSDLPAAQEQTAKKKTVEDIISRHAYIDKVINPEGEGDLYLIGQKHYIFRFNEKGNTTAVPSSNKTIVDVQCDDFFLLKDLILESELDFVIGESEKKREFDVSEEGLEKGRIYGPGIMGSRKKALRFFTNNPHAIAYEALKHFLPDRFKLTSIGEGDVKEKRDELRERMKERVNLYRNTYGINGRLDVGEVAKHDPVLLGIVKEDCGLNNEVNRWYLSEGPRLADELGYRNFAIVIGLGHLRGMMEEYKGKRRLLVIRPKSYPININDMPLDGFEGFKQHYGFDK
ncbi:hypothetical protein KY343_00905 [Candidatus Woesearchaeota archaeon]|nr:hypothetical protein [Candidatus Woesearchaeota archaeon]